MKYERSECFNLAIFRVRNGFYLVFCRNRDWNGVFLMFLTFFFEPFLVGKVMKENLLRKVRKSEKRKVKNIRKNFKLVFLRILININSFDVYHMSNHSDIQLVDTLSVFFFIKSQLYVLLTIQSMEQVL